MDTSLCRIILILFTFPQANALTTETYQHTSANSRSEIKGIFTTGNQFGEDNTPYNGPTTEMWFGKGQDCLNRIWGVYQLFHLTKVEYMCLCFDQCFDNEEDVDEFEKDFVQDLKNSKDIDKKSVKGVFYGLIFVTGLFGNILVLVAVSRFMGRVTVTNIYVMNLAAADLLVILFCVPTKAVESIYLSWPSELGEAGCRVMLGLYFGSFMCSTFTLMFMAIERYMVITHPMKMQSISSLKRTAVVVVFIWILGVSLASPAVVLAEVTDGDSCVIESILTEGNERLAFYLYVFIVILLIPSIFMGFAYTSISITLWKSIQKQKNMQNSQKEEDKQAAGRIQEAKWVIRVLISVLIVFVTCWTPYLALQVHFSSNHDVVDFERTNVLNETLVWFNMLSLGNSCLNPILYGVMSRSFRMSFIRCLTCNRKGQEPVKSYISASNTTGVLHSHNTSVTNNYSMTTVVKQENETAKNGTITSSNGEANVEENKQEEKKEISSK